MIPWGECVSFILWTGRDCSDWDQVYRQIATRVEWTTQKLSGLALLVQVPSPALAKIIKRDLFRVIVTNLRIPRIERHQAKCLHRVFGAKLKMEVHKNQKRQRDSSKS